MPQEELLGEELSLLRSQRGRLCISVIVPLSTYGPEREQNTRSVEQAIEKTVALWDHLHPGQPHDGWLDSLLALKEKMDPIHPPQGVGFFISENVHLACPFPFAPKEKIVIGDSFEIRDLLHRAQLERSYWLLTLTHQSARLYRGKNDQLQALRETGLSRVFKEAYEYSPPSRSTSYAGHSHVKSFEREPQDIAAIRAAHHFSKVDKIVSSYRLQDDPLLLIADERSISLFKEITVCPTPLLLTLAKDPAHFSEHQLAQMAQPMIRTFAQQQLQQLIVKYQESVGWGQTRDGLQACWRAAQEGNCRYLLVEDTYSQPGFLAGDPYYLLLTPPLHAHRTLTDAVDDLIELVMEKDGKVFLVPPGMLPEPHRVVLITRY